MKKFFMFLLIFLSVSMLFAQNVTVTLKNGKTISGKITKIESAQLGGKSIVEATSVLSAQGVNELMILFKDVKEIDFKSSDDVSCYDDSRFVPVRKVCTMKSLYHVTLKTPGESKEPIEVVDDKVFFFHIEGQKAPVPAFFYKIMVTNEGNEAKKDYPDLEREVLELSKNGIKKISFN